MGKILFGFLVLVILRNNMVFAFVFNGKFCMSSVSFIISFNYLAIICTMLTRHDCS